MFPYAACQLVELCLCLLDLGLRAFHLGVAARPIERGGELGRVETVQDSFDDEELERVGLDVHVSAAAEVGAFRADVAALAGCCRARDERLPAATAAQQADEQVAAGALVRSPRGIGKQGSDTRRLGGGDDRRPFCRADNLPAVLALAADARGHEHPPERLRLPLSTRHRRYAPLVQVAADRPQRLAREQAPRALAHDHRLRLAQCAPIGLVPVRPRPSARDLARLRQLLVLSPDAPALVVALLLRHGPEDTSEELSVVGSEVDVARDRGKARHPGLSANVEEVLQLLRLAMQAIGVPHNHRVQEAFAQIVEHSPIRGPHAPLVCAHVVIDVALGDLPSLAFDQTLAVLDLAAQHPADRRPGRRRCERRWRLEPLKEHTCTLAWASVLSPEPSSRRT